MLQDPLQKAIDKLKNEFEFKASVADFLPEVKKLVYLSSPISAKTTKCLNFDLKKDYEKPLKELLQIIKETYPATGEFYVHSHKGEVQTASRYKLTARNGIRDNHFTIQYESNDIAITIQVPAKFYNTSRHYRGVTDCEYHYFGGVSMSEIRQIKLVCLVVPYFRTLSYFGGDIYHYPADADEAEEYDRILFEGNNE